MKKTNNDQGQVRLKCAISLTIFVPLIIVYHFLFSIIFAFVHELSHTVVALLNGCEIYEFVISSIGWGYVTHSQTTDETLRLIVMAGSVGKIMFGFVIILHLVYLRVRKGIRLPSILFLSLYIFTWLMIRNEIWYWFNDIGDPAVYLSVTPNINRFILSLTLLYVTIVFLIIFILVLVKVYETEIRTIVQRKVH